MTDTTSRTASAGQTARSGRVLGQWNSAVTTYYVLCGATALLVVLGLVMVLSSSAVRSIATSGSPYGVFARQAIYAVVGLVALVIASRMPTVALRRVAWPVLLASMGMQALVVLTPLGLAEGGNRNWLPIGPVVVQPSEFVKFGLALWLGAVLARKGPLLHEWRHAVIPAVPVTMAAVGLVLAGHDLGTGLIVIFLAAGALFVAGVPMRIFGVAAIVALAVIGWMVRRSDNRIGRVLNWLSDECDLQGACYQPKHGLWALGTGGVSGVGMGASREKWSYLPAAHNDFIYAIIGEELGLVGTLLVLALFGLVAFAVLRLVARHSDPFARIATGAIGAWIVGQALLNIAVVIGLAPVIGIPLPLVSAGGSALIMSMAAMGVLISFARTEPGAPEALAARSGVLRRSIAVIGRSGQPGRRRRGAARG